MTGVPEGRRSGGAYITMYSCVISEHMSVMQGKSEEKTIEIVIYLWCNFWKNAPF